MLPSPRILLQGEEAKVKELEGSVQLSYDMSTQETCHLGKDDVKLLPRVKNHRPLLVPTRPETTFHF